MTLTLLTEAIDLASVSPILRSPFRFRLFTILGAALALLLVSALSGKVVAQQNATAAPILPVAAATSSPDDTRYRIGPGDVISVVVRKAPELSGGVRVDQRGMIRLPMIEGDVRVACL